MTLKEKKMHFLIQISEELHLGKIPEAQATALIKGIKEVNDPQKIQQCHHCEGWYFWHEVDQYGWCQYCLDRATTKKAWRRLRDKANKNKQVQEELVRLAILGGLAPTTIRCLD